MPEQQASTIFATSSGFPKRGIGVRPPAIRSSYFWWTTLVMSVSMMPGRTSNTGMPSAASLSAKSMVTMETPALLMQYSPREVLDV